MKKVLLILAAMVAMSGKAFSQEVNVVDSKYKSVFQVSTENLNIHQLIATFEVHHVEERGPEVIYKNDKADIFVIEYYFNWMKDPQNRWWSVVIPCKCVLRDGNLNVVIDNLKLEYFKTMDSEDGKGRTELEKGENHLSEESQARVKEFVTIVKSDIENVIKKHLDYWK